MSEDQLLKTYKSSAERKDEDVWTAMASLQNRYHEMAALLVKTQANMNNFQQNMRASSFNGPQVPIAVANPSQVVIKKEIHPPIKSLRFERKTILVIGGVKNGQECDTMTVFNSSGSKWIQLQLKSPIQTAGSGAVLLNEEIYLVGGYGHPKSLYKLNKNLEWRRLADMNVGRTRIANSCVEWKGRIWVFGGEDKNGYLRNVECYYPKENKWKQMPDMKCPRASATAIFFAGRFLVCGGHGNDAILDRTEYFVPGEPLWIEHPPLPQPVSGHSLITYGDRLTVLGGHGGTACYSLFGWLGEEGWTPLPSMKYPSSHFTGTVVGQTILAIGGRQQNRTILDRVEIFDGEQWLQGPAFPYKTYLHTAVVISDELAGRLCGYVDRNKYF